MIDDLTRKISEALGALAGEIPLREGAKSLLNALGYTSNRTADAGTVGDFLESFRPEKPLTDKQRRLFDDWRKVEIVFQVTDDEIELPTNQRGLFDGPGFDRGRAKSFLFLAVDMQSGAYPRAHLAETMRAVNRLFRMPVIVLFRHGPALTLAAIHRRAHKRDDNRDVLEKVTLVKDIRLENPHRAHIEILADLRLRDMVEAGVHSFDDLHVKWEQVLDIEALNKRFYKELFEWFERAVEECRFPNDGAGDGCAQRHIIRLITRLLFIWFLKEKGLVSEDLFEERFARECLKDYKPGSTGYYRAVLQNLFFATLNTEIDRRAFSTETRASHRDFNKYRYRSLLQDPESFVEKLKQVPFVNGGLFDCLDDFAAAGEGGRRIDAFTDNVETQGQDLYVPARLLLGEPGGLFALFRDYKFTVEENTPLDREVALDPELLGRVFENLLAAYNPETRKTARKATGSYYTPRLVVDYMVGEVLVAALAEKAHPSVPGDEFWRDRLHYLLNWENSRADAGDFFEAAEAKSLVQAIAGLRVLDPAAGSGAFPMGVLHRLTLALRRLDSSNALWEDFQKERAGQAAAAAIDTADKAARDAALLDVSRIFETYKDSDYGRKLYLIQNGIFGVDLQPIACQIAKLRFFISLVVEQDAHEDPTDNYGIRPLPNLETRFVAADALIGLGTARQEILRSDAVRQLEDRLRRVRERYFNARTRIEKLSLRSEDARIRTALAQELEADFGPDDARTITAWDPYDHSGCAGWFDPEWMFGISDGFDIVIGNPPYVRADFPDDGHQRTRQAILEHEEYETLWEKWDLFIPFIERGYKMLTKGGFTTMIVSDAYCHSKYAQKSQNWFLKNSKIIRLDFLSKIKIFDAAVRNVIYLFHNENGEQNRPDRRVHISEFGATDNLRTDEQRNLTHRAFFPEEDEGIRFVIATVLLDKICYISKGMVVHSDERRAKGEFELRDVVSDNESEIYSKRFVEGKHLDRWILTQNRWLEWGTQRAPSLFSRRTFPEMYEVAEKMISVDMAAGVEKLKVVYDDQQLHHNHSAWSFIPWYSLSGVRNRSIKKQTRYRDERPRRPDLPRREALEATSRRFSVKFLLGVMNSSVARDFLRASRRSNIHLYPDDWKKLPIPDVSQELQIPVAELVGRIIEAKRADAAADVTEEEAEIDRLVYALYGLDAEEEATGESAPGS